ncbi:MFS transporter [Pelagibaculum spongiae]|uniref:MFS transporter n=1 Tax=Pelagibaculum spongiae TaxID=2080658 RepID=A0A2V1H0Y8_9GAMM|nr:MFS transporter [Pelagibaculum spongiae]PVZ72143.1 MFS transporter [Pelagibaculum spongiae]
MKKHQNPELFLYLLAAAVPISFGVWQALLNNFAIEQAAFGGSEIGILQSLREIPGFLAFTVILVLSFFSAMGEQRLALISILLMGLGTALTGYFPSEVGLYCTTVLMSLGFHYFETLNQSLSLQWFEKKNAAYKLGRMMAIGSFASLFTYGLVWFTLDILNISMPTLYLVGGGISMLIALYCWLRFPQLPTKVEQHKKLLMRKRYWLYYLLTFMGGARRQIFVVFASFLMVEKFGFSAAEVAVMFLANGLINMFLAPKIGQLIDRWGERTTLSLEYIGLIIIFVAYALVTDPMIAVVLYILDHLLFSMAIAQKTYFQKIADPKDLASTAGVAFSINHIAAVILPVLYGILWLSSPALVFLTGAVLAFISLLLARLVPTDPMQGNEVLWARLEKI